MEFSFVEWMPFLAQGVYNGVNATPAVIYQQVHNDPALVCQQYPTLIKGGTRSEIETVISASIVLVL